MGEAGEAQRLLEAGLWALPGPGAKSLAAVRERHADPARIVDEPFERWLPQVQLPAQAGDVLAAARELGVRTPAESARRLFARCRAAGQRWAFKGEPAYPARLAEVASAPPLLFFDGPGAEGTSRRRVALVGTRTPETAFEGVAIRLAATLAYSGFGVISGAARGIDTYCHDAALGVHGETWAFLGSSLDAVDATAGQVARRIVAGGGSVFTDYPPGVRGDTFTFPRRNRLIAGAADAVVVLRAPLKSGALYTARAGARQGRPVLAMPAEIGSGSAAGTNKLLQEGTARVCLCAGDVVRALGLVPERVLVEPPEKVVDLGAFPPRTRQVLLALAGRVLDFDALLVASGLEAGALSAELFDLEMAGAVRELPGRTYAAARLRR